MSVEKALLWALQGFAFTLPVSIAVSEPLGYLSVLLALWLYVREGRRPFAATPFRWGMLLFVLVAALSYFWSVRPSATLAKLDRFLLLFVIVAIPLAWRAEKADAGAWLWKLALFFVVGALLQSASDLVSIPIAYFNKSRAYDALALAGQLPRGALRPTIFDMGNMRDPQMYLVSLSLLLGWYLYRKADEPTRWWWAALVLNGCAFVLQFKRGAWLAFLISVGVMASASRRRRVLVALLLVVAGVLAVPQVRDRLAHLKDEMRVRTGGRYSLWTRTAVPMMRDYPWGMGWKAPRNEDFKKYERNIQPKLNHLHNNAMQVRLETGWIGLAFWLAWMLAAFTTLWRLYRFALARALPWTGVAFGALCGFLALQLNGLVEYNFGDAEIFMLMILLMGFAAFGWSVRSRILQDESATTPAPAAR